MSNRKRKEYLNAYNRQSENTLVSKKLRKIIEFRKALQLSTSFEMTAGNDGTQRYGTVKYSETATIDGMRDTQDDKADDTLKNTADIKRIFGDSGGVLASTSDCNCFSSELSRRNSPLQRSTSDIGFKELLKRNFGLIKLTRACCNEVTITRATETQSLDKTSPPSNLTLQHNFFYITKNDKPAPEVQLKMFSSLMLHAWRVRRQEVKIIYDEIEKYKQQMAHYKNQIHVFTNLRQGELVRNQALEKRLKSLEEYCSGFHNKIVNLKGERDILLAQKIDLQSQLKSKQKNLDSITHEFERAKALLLRIIGAQKDLEMRLQQNEFDIEMHQKEKADLEETLRIKKVYYENGINEKERCIAATTNRLNELSERLRTSKESFQEEIKEKAEMIADLRNELVSCNRELGKLKLQLHSTLSHRVKLAFSNIFMFALDVAALALPVLSRT